ncbi:hypothetical protein [Paenibacillus tengchongensis]|uniref:hypothetical protein n=1 Tax=Paenibacillus tengchongensis TaxID=2608684 RepID=UPI00124BFF9E|nr:hypothetical protein [Paenibacillus tengchongensis]
MAILSTGPIDNTPVDGIRPTQLVTVRLVSRAAVEAISVTIQGYVLNGTRTLYVSEVVDIAPNQALIRNYYADLNGFEFVFNTGPTDIQLLGLSVWGKRNTGELAAVHRIVAQEQLMADINGSQL